MKSLLCLVLLWLFVACTINSCTKVDVAGPVSYDTIYVSDSMRFYFSYTDTIEVIDRCELSKDLGGVQVELIGLGRTAITDSIGAFTIDRIPDGLSWSLRYSRTDIYTRILRLSLGDRDPISLHRHHDYSARFDSAVKVKPQKKVVTRDTMVLNWENQWITIKVKDTVSYDLLSFYFTGTDAAGSSEASAVPYLLLSRQPQIDPIDTTSYFFIGEANPPGIGISTLQLADSGIVKGDKLYYAVTSRPRCTIAKLNPKHPTPGRRMSEIREITIP